MYAVLQGLKGQNTGVLRGQNTGALRGHNTHLTQRLQRGREVDSSARVPRGQADEIDGRGPVGSLGGVRNRNRRSWPLHVGPELSSPGFGPACGCRYGDGRNGTIDAGDEIGTRFDLAQRTMERMMVVSGTTIGGLFSSISTDLLKASSLLNVAGSSVSSRRNLESRTPGVSPGGQATSTHATRLHESPETKHPSTKLSPLERTSMYSGSTQTVTLASEAKAVVRLTHRSRRSRRPRRRACLAARLAPPARPAAPPSGAGSGPAQPSSAAAFVLR